jgi:isopenicillin N synthase-like dioxygenase
LSRSCAEEYAQQSSSLTLILLNLIATSLGLPEGSVDELLGSDEKAQVFGRTRVNHYPVCANSQLTWGLQGHTDPSILTLLHQDDVGGLQICFKDKSWHGVQPIKGAIVVNIGDYLLVSGSEKLLQG